MKKLTFILLSMLVSTSLMAQNTAFKLRQHIENTTDYSQPTVSRHHRVGSRSTAPLPCLGSPKIPVILVQFPNLPFTSDVLVDKSLTHSDENVNALYNKYFNGNEDGTLYTGAGSSGSVRDYFAIVSDSLFTPEFGVIGPVTVGYDYEYYGKDNSDTNKDVNIGKFFIDACRLAVFNYDVDWSQFDNNNDGKVDLVFFIYAGEGQNAYGNLSQCKKDGFPEKASLIWPKEGISTLKVVVDETNTITFGAYGCTNEIYNNAIDGMGTVAHEVSHGLGLADHYDNDHKLFGMDYWDLMDSGNYCKSGRQPAGYSAYEKDFMGWRMLKEIPLDCDTTIVLNPIHDKGIGIKITNPSNANDYYILENRQNKLYDGYLGLAFTFKSTLGYSAVGMTHGLMVTHVQYNSSTWTSNRINTGQECLTIIPADGTKYTMDVGDKTYIESILGDLYPGMQEVRTFKLLNQSFEVTENDDLTITLKINNGSTIYDGVSSIIADSPRGDNTLYDLSGRRLLDKPSSGFYIQNGKKYWVR